MANRVRIQIDVSLTEIVALQHALESLAQDKDSLVWSPADPRSLTTVLRRLLEEVQAAWIRAQDAPVRMPPASGAVCAARQRPVAHMTRTNLLETLSAAGIEHEIVSTPRGIIETAVLVRPSSLHDLGQEAVVRRLTEMIPFPWAHWGASGCSFYV